MNKKEETYIAIVKGKANEWLSKPENSQNKLALGAGLSSGTISPFMRGTYTGNNLAVAEQLDKFFEMEFQRRGTERNKTFVRTRQSNAVINACIQAHAYNNMTVLIGDSGIGKTMGLREYAKNPNVYYIQCNPFMRGRTGFLQQLCISLNLPAMGNQIASYNRLAKVASEKGALIILDDAQTLNNKGATNTTVFEVIRALFDEGIGFVISGNGKVRETVTETDTEELYQQFASRARQFEIKSDFTEEDVKNIFFQIVGEELEPDQFNFLYELSIKFYGSLRLAASILELALNRAKFKKIPLSLRLLQDASKHNVSQMKPQYRTAKKPGVTLNGKQKDSGNNEPIEREDGQARSQVA
jgi:DNA transposition AAA+ family ATPase